MSHDPPCHMIHLHVAKISKQYKNQDLVTAVVPSGCQIIDCHRLVADVAVDCHISGC